MMFPEEGEQEERRGEPTICARIDKELIARGGRETDEIDLIFQSAGAAGVVSNRMQSARGSIPEPNSFVIATGHQMSSARRELDGIDSFGVSLGGLLLVPIDFLVDSSVDERRAILQEIEG
jgi:hypothetical protein